MALQGLYGEKRSYIGFDPWNSNVSPASGQTTIDATNEAIIFIGQIETSDGGSHTIDTTGSSSIGWRAETVTFANAGTTVKVGIAAVLTTAGPPGRAAHAADVISFDVSKSMTGGGGGITGSAWQTHVPDAGTKTIAHGDLVAVCIQMTARGGADSILVTYRTEGLNKNRPLVTSFLGGSYAAVGGDPNVLITFSDGAYGWIGGGCAQSVLTTTRTWNSGSATKEYGQLFQLPFPVKIYGFYGYIDPDADFDMVLYSDPLGTPVAERTLSYDSNVVATATLRRFEGMFTTPYTTTADQKIGMVYKPGASNVSTVYLTLANAAHRVALPWGTSGYGISRATGAFADANSSLDHYYIGLIVGAYEHGVQPTYVLGI